MIPVSTSPVPAGRRARRCRCGSRSRGRRGVGDHGARPLQQHDRVEPRPRGRAPRRRDRRRPAVPASRAYSPACGVRIAGGEPGRVARRAAASGSTASAFERVGVDDDRDRALGDDPAHRGLRARRRARARDRSRARGSARCPSATAAAASASSAPSASAGSARVTISLPPTRAAASAPGTRAHHHARAARAPRHGSPAAARPIMPVEPPTTSTPDDHLWPSVARGAAGERSATSSTCSRGPTPGRVDADVDDVHAPGAARARARRAAPASAPRSTPSRRARTAAPRTSPVVPSTPDGMSTASVGDARRRERVRRRSAASPSSAPRKPVPNIASIARSARASARRRHVASTPSASANTSTPTPARAQPAAPRPTPSAPLLPLPHTTTTRRP